MASALRDRLLERGRIIAQFLRSGSYRTVCAYRWFRTHRPVADKTVLFESYFGARISCNPYAIFTAMLADPDFSDFTFVWTLNVQDDPTNLIHARLKKLPNVRFCRRNSFAYARHLATAKYLVTNKAFHYYFAKRPEQVHISTWHGTTLKTLGKHQYGSMGQYHNVTRNYLQVDYLVMPNRFTADVMLDSCDVRSLFSGVVIDAGQPRSDLTINADPDEVRRTLAGLLGIDPAKRIVLYAPTWRGEVGDALDITDQLVANITELSAGLPEGHELLLKVHDKTYAFAQENSELRMLRNVPDWFETNELLAAVDILITDYSSIFFDFLVLRRPIIHYAFDYTEYLRTRGMYFDMETEMAGPLCTTAAEVNAAIARIDEVADEYRERHERLLERFGYNEDGHVSERVVDIIFRGRRLEYTYRVEDTGKIRVLAFAGGLDASNEALQRAISSLDFTRIDFVLLLEGLPKKRDEYYLSKLHPDIKVLYWVGTPARRLAKRLIAEAGPDSATSRATTPEAAAAWREELVGEVRFDVAVDFTGRFSLWQLIFAHTPFLKRVVFLPPPFGGEAAEVPMAFLSRHFDVLVCPSKQSFDHYRDRLVGSPAADKLVLRPIPASLADYMASLSDDVAHLVAGIDYCVECEARSLDPYCQTSDLLFEFRVGGLERADLAKAPEVRAALDEVERKVIAELGQSDSEDSECMQGFADLFRVAGASR